MRRPKQEPVDFVKKIRLGTTEEEAEEEPAEILERHAPKWSQEQRAKELAPTVEGNSTMGEGNDFDNSGTTGTRRTDGRTKRGNIRPTGPGQRTSVARLWQ